MTQDERSALVIERADLQRKYTKRKDVAGYAANCEHLAKRIEEIDAKLDAPPVVEPQAEPEPADQPISETLSLAGKTLADPDATPTEKSLAAKVLSNAASE